jgi:hypothetical protein
MMRKLIGVILVFATFFCFANEPGFGPAPEGYYLLLEKEGNSWKVDSIGLTPPSVTDSSKQEIIYSDNWYGEFDPYYSDYVQWYQNTYPMHQLPGDARYAFKIRGYKYLCFSGAKKERPTYNPCDSSLTSQKHKGLNAGFDVVSVILSLGRSTTVSVDNEKLDYALKSSDAINMLKTYQQKATEQSDFEHATSSIALKNFIAKYQNNDPDGLVAQTEEQLPDVEAKETAEALALYRHTFDSASTASDFEAFISKYQGNDPDNLVPRVQNKLKSIIAQKDVEQKQARKELTKWQNDLQVGDDTNCGEVLELRRGLVKVNFPVENYGNEHWIKKNLIRKPGTGCGFINGNYDPSYDG